MSAIKDIAKKNNIFIVEDSAQAIESKYNGQYSGTLGDIGCYSFHETKNFICGEGGAIVLNNDKYIERAEIIREKGTNRNKFYRGEVDKYTWLDIGSSYLPSEILSAFLYGQLEKADLIMKSRISSWNYYYTAFKELESGGYVNRPIIPENCTHNAHMFYLLLNDESTRDLLISYLRAKNILAVFHYLPLHLSPMGMKMGYKKGMFPVTENISSRIVRLPLFYNISRKQQHRVINNIYNFFKAKGYKKRKFQSAGF
jgi:dTDP-4-amino-4,6-dideoxygalactose transaminase